MESIKLPATIVIYSGDFEQVTIFILKNLKGSIYPIIAKVYYIEK